MRMRAIFPPGWRQAVLQDLVFFQRGFDITKAQQKPGNIPVVSSSGINSFHSEAKVDGPGVIIGRKGSLGTVHYADGPYWPHDTTLWSKDLRGNLPRFVFYYLKILGLERYDVGNSNPTLNRNHIHNLEIQLPEYRIQEKVVNLLSAYDDLIENNRRRIQLLEQAARLLYKEWFVHLRFPGHEHVKIKDGVPEGWEKGVVSDFYNTASGGTPSRRNPEFYGGNVKWVKTQELQNGFLFDTAEYITEDAIKKSAAKLFPTNTVLIAMYGATIGQVGVIVEPSACNQACCAVMPKAEGTSCEHAFLFFLSNKEGLRNLGQGAAQKNISQQVIRGYEMILPDKLMLKMFQNNIEPFLSQIRTLQAMNQQLANARDLLLPKLMIGEVAV